MIEVLMVEDDEEMIVLLEQYLPRYGINLFSITSPLAAINKLQTQNFDLILLDLSLPEMDGLELCKQIKSRFDNIPIIISTARADVTDKVIGFDAGADDYIAKPYDPRELVARIQVQIKRAKQSQQKSEMSPFRVDESKFVIYKGDTPLELTMAEYDIFRLLLQNRHMVVSREFIVNSSDVIQWESSDRSINVIVSRLRQKIGDDVKHPVYIKSIRGVGYQYIGS